MNDARLTMRLPGEYLLFARGAQLCPTLSDPMDCSLPGSSIHDLRWLQNRLHPRIISRASQVMQWCRISLPMQEMQVRSLGQEDSHG